ncbi:MAG: hypothetical protein KR126chlam3_01186 [Chlamydiae bacterium]|nr:hypothetical protein [Chlamydiota bacterium]
MRLDLALGKCKSISDCNDIFDGGVKVQLKYLNDSVTVEGYEGSVTTDSIANKITTFGFIETEDSKRLAGSLAKKVFIPLKKLVEAPENQCSLYQLAALTRIGWTPPPASEFGGSIALKHAMALGFLDEKKYFMG